MLRPRRTPTRELLRLDGLWRFALDADAGAEPFRAVLDTPLEAPVPASYNDLFADRSIREHVGWVWYQRTVRVPRGWAGERIRIRIDAATHEGRVYIGDTLVAEHIGGYTPFEADITAQAVAGNEIRVTIAVNNELTNETIPPGTVTTDPDGRRRQTYRHDFFNYGGLARSVWLYSVPPDHVEDITVVTRLDGSTALVDYRVDLAGSGELSRQLSDADGAIDLAGSGELSRRLSDADGAIDLAGSGELSRRLSDADGAIDFAGSGELSLRLSDADGAVVAEGSGPQGTLRVDEARLWRPGDGYLHTLEVELRRGGTVVDSYELPVGIRTVEVRGAEFLINGAPFAFRGFGRHEDNTVRGKGHDDVMMVHDFALMDWVGANSFRTSHYPYAEEVIDYADRKGIVVIGETAAVGLNIGMGAGFFWPAEEGTYSPQMFNDATRESHAQAVRELIARDKNHPSVVMWSLMNEPDTVEDGARQFYEPTVELARRLDPTRPLMYAIESRATPHKDRIVDLFDVICLNRYLGWYLFPGDLERAAVVLEDELRSWESAHGKPIIVGEYGADTISGFHSVTAEPWTEEYQSALLDAYHNVFDRVDAVVGEHVWNFADFQTQASFMRVDGNKKGVFTRDRRPKAAAHLLRRRWRSDRTPDPQNSDDPP